MRVRLSDILHNYLLVFFVFFVTFVVIELSPAPDAYAVHRASEKVKCLDCHSWLPFNNSKPSFHEGVGETCAGCHRDYHGTADSFSHPINIRSSAPVPRDMPLDRKGRITCVTCHTFHNVYGNSDSKKPFLLRRPQGKTFCYACHKKALF